MLNFSFIIPVFNRPEEIEELLQSFVNLGTDKDYEIVIVEDGSTLTSKDIIKSFNDQLNIAYYQKSNSGPGDSRNFGMSQAKGNYYIILDSDVLLPSNYLTVVNKSLVEDFVHCYGGPDAAHASFSSLQKAIDFSMTSFITTGGLRGGKTQLNKFQPRSFNMGLSEAAFKASGGFGHIHPGEDPDLSIRLWDLGFKTKLIPEAYVYHKRRVSLRKFAQQVYKFGLVRPILNLWHPKTKSITYIFPALFSIGFIISVFLLLFSVKIPFLLYGIYFIMVLTIAFFRTKSIVIALLAVIAVFIQFFGYGYGFLKSAIHLNVLKRKPEKQFPKLFFNLP